jgi:iron complex transport system ATP-binding protein
MSNEEAVRVKRLSFSYGGKRVLEKIDLNIIKGKFYAVLGPNGSGKTTLLRNIAKSVDLKEGTVFIKGNDVKLMRRKSLAKELAVVPQSVEYQFDFSVLDLVLMGRAPYLPRFAMENDTDLQIAQEVMEIMDIWHLKDRRVHTLSGGERQRAMVARAMTQKTGIILLDEPVSHLDIYHQIELLKQIKTLNKTGEITVLAVLHDLNLAAAFGDYLIFMNQGKIHSLGTPAEVCKEEIIKAIYGVEVEVRLVPETGRPFIIPKIDYQ